MCLVIFVIYRIKEGYEEGTAVSNAIAIINASALISQRPRQIASYG